MENKTKHLEIYGNGFIARQYPSSINIKTKATLLLIKSKEIL